jgi:2-hydroxychromene-2-carboxylate isomerase
MAEDRIDFWLTLGSTYSYLSVTRIGAVAKTAGVNFRWRPFAGVRALTGAAPFPDGAAKTRYMWRDIERRANMYGIPLKLPVPYPSANLRLANSVAFLGMREGWGEQFVCASYRHWFQHGEENGGEPHLRASLAECGQDFERVVALSQGDTVQHDLDAETDEARRIGIFGAPSFVVGSEIFWGDDRLDDAINWFKHSRLGPSGQKP